MSQTGQYQHPRHFIHSLREYVLSPISKATRLIEQERSEVATELEAFKEFRNRIMSIEPIEREIQQYPSSRYEWYETGEKPIEEVLSAYRDTVIDTSHYDDVYDEPLIKNISQELGPDIALGLRADTSISFTSPYKQALVTSVSGVVSGRVGLIDTLDNEANSIAEAESALKDILAALDITTIPEWYCDSFNSQIDNIAERRQKEGSSSQYDAYSLCGYLYQENKWIFPVLTALARLRESVTLDSYDREHILYKKIYNTF